MTLFIHFFIYIVSAYCSYMYIQLAHYHKDGIYKNSTPEKITIFFTFFPFINTFFCIVSWLFIYPIKDYKKGTDFFKPKK